MSGYPSARLVPSVSTVVGGKPLSSEGNPRLVKSAIRLFSYELHWEEVTHWTHRLCIGQTTSGIWDRGPQSRGTTRRTFALPLRSAGSRLWAKATERVGQRDRTEEVQT